MSSTERPSRRIVRMQRQIHNAVRADVRRIIGPQSREIRRYYEAYKREFRAPSRRSDRDELLKECLASDIILLGDYHTFAQSQKTAIRLLEQLVEHDPWLAFAVELVPSRHQALLNDFMSGALGEADFLSAIDYERTWGFSWAHFKPLFDFARKHNLEVIGLNHESERLETRDSHAASLVARFAVEHPRRRIFVLYGDLHLAAGHLPSRIRAELRAHEARRRLTTVFQNSETLYWRLAKSRDAHAHSTDVLALGRGRFCIMSAAPWVKLQSYLEWAEAGELVDPSSASNPDDEATPDLADLARERLRHLLAALGMPDSVGQDFAVRTTEDLAFLGSRAATGAHSPLKELTREQLKTVKYHVFGSRSVFIPEAGILYLASPSFNAISESVTLYAHARLSGSALLYSEPREHLFSAILTKAIAYFGSKLLNHKRKCDLERDYQRTAARALGRGALKGERRQQKVARHVLRLCAAEREFLRTDRYRAPAAPRGPDRVPVFLESASGIGAILGEKLYAAFVAGSLPAAEIEELFRSKLDDVRAAREIYLRLVTRLESAELPHLSKNELF